MSSTFMILLSLNSNLIVQNIPIEFDSAYVSRVNRNMLIYNGIIATIKFNIELQDINANSWVPIANLPVKPNTNNGSNYSICVNLTNNEFCDCVINGEGDIMLYLSEKNKGGKIQVDTSFIIHK